MTNEELKSINLEIYSNDNFIFWVEELPESVKLASDLTPFRRHNVIHDKYENDIGVVYFEKSINNIYYIVTIKEYSSMEKLLGSIIKKLIYY